jgi:hypothetical protein
MTRFRALVLIAVAASALTACDAFQKGFKKGLVDAEMDGWADKGEYGGIYTEMRKDFPNDYAGLKKTLGDKYAGGGDEQAVAHEAFTFMRSFIAQHINDLAKAPDDDLVALAQQQHDLMHLLQQENVQACGDLSMSAMREGTKLSDKATALTMKAVTVELHAVRDGIDHPTPHPPFVMSEAEKTSLLQTLASKGMSIPAGGAQEASADVQCEVGVAAQDMILGMSKDRVAAFEAGAAQAAGAGMH